MAKSTPPLGEFEHLVLAAALRLDDGAYGVSIAEEIERATVRHVGSGALSVTLDRLEKKGYIRSRPARPTPDRGGRPKRLVRVTAAGVRALRDSRAALLTIWQGLEPKLER